VASSVCTPNASLRKAFKRFQERLGMAIWILGELLFLRASLLSFDGLSLKKVSQERLGMGIWTPQESLGAVIPQESYIRNRVHRGFSPTPR